MKPILLLMISLLSFQAWSQTQKFQLKGSLGTNPESKKSIEFTLDWEETEGRLTGSYSDNYYALTAPLKGVASDTQGRILIVTLPKENNGVRTLSFLGSDLKGKQGAALIPVGVVLRDEKGTPVSTKQIEGNLIAVNPATQSVVAQKQEQALCQDGFGSLAGFCGVYDGMITEEMDPKKKCDLLTFNNSHLVLDDNAEMGLSLGEVSEIISTPVHRIGRLQANPESTNVDLMSRACRPLAGTTFKGDDCKRLALIGSFTIKGKTKHFAGNYTIVDENTNESCRYSLSMDQHE